MRKNMYDMYPYGGSRNPDDTAPLTLRATREEAAAKGWALDEIDYAEATHVAVATRLDHLEAIRRPFSSQAAQLSGNLTLSHS